MKDISNQLRLLLCAAFLLAVFVPAAQAIPLMLNFQIEDPLGGQYDNAEFSYIIDKENPYWSEIEGDTFMDQNRYLYNVALYQADAILGMLPDFILQTSTMVGDIESGGTEFRAGSHADGTYMDISSLRTWYFWDILNNAAGYPIRFEFIAQALNLTPATHDWAHAPHLWLNSVEPMPEPIPEPATAFLFGTGLALLIRKQYRA